MKNPREVFEDFIKFIPNHGAEIDTCPYCKKGGLIDTALAQLEEYYKPKEKCAYCPYIKVVSFTPDSELAKKVIEELRQEIKELKATPLEPIDENALKDFIGNFFDGMDAETIVYMRWCFNGDLAKAISDKFGVSNKLEGLGDKDDYKNPLGTLIFNTILQTDLWKKREKNLTPVQLYEIKEKLLSEIVAKFGSPARGKDI